MSSYRIFQPDFEDRLRIVTPYLFEMANKTLSVATPDRWNILIGDDTSGRLPALFLRRVLARRAITPAVRYVAGSRALRETIGRQPYDAYFSEITEELGEDLRPLVVTESVGTGEGITFLRSALDPYSDAEVEVASVVDREGQEGMVQFAGSYGEQASFEVFHTFETVAVESLRGRLNVRIRQALPRRVKQRVPQRLKPLGLAPSNGLTGVYADATCDLPTARRRPTPRTHHSYQLVEQLVDKYFEFEPAQRP